MTSSGHHPVDRYSKSAAQTTNAANLTEAFEQACYRGHKGDIEMIGAVAIARVQILETVLKDCSLALDEPELGLAPALVSVSNVVELRSAKSAKSRRSRRPRGSAA